ncbi:MAG TPA: 23S rRNA (uracil(1939)-C(5))-methyltransferase RlmD [Salinisphaeraceae bacterium]|nr:23S rRNA (uracil(1939)-C(5))-methyltransferase RlmD [Salinisphaeraceae bacterium]
MTRRRSRRKPAPRNLARIDDLASNAAGVAHVDGKAVFVADALPGEQVLYRPTRRKRNYDEARLETLFSASPERVTPGCAHFGVCGGCALQHLQAEAQLAFKQEQLLQALQRVGHVAPAELLAPLAAARWHYRRRARLGVKHVPKKGGTLVGFRERGAPYIAVLERCEVLVEQVGTRLTDLARLIDGLSIKTQVPQIEVAAGDNATALVFRVLAEPDAADRAALQVFAEEHGFVIYLQPGNESTITPLSAKAPALYYDLPAHAVRLYFEPHDFVQIHAGINRLMVDQALQMLAAGRAETVLELFAGLGNFSLPLARHARRVITVEGAAELVARAGANARANGLANIEAHVADLFRPDPHAPWLHCGFDVVLLDPPRSGAAEILPLVAARKPRRIVYCSCHPATLARDAGMLVHQYGYRLTHAGVMDMFPHTAHVESMAVFERS